MNYGYDTSDPDIRIDRAEALATRLRALLATFPADARGQRPYVEVGECHPETETLYQGVRIRRLTHYDDTTLGAIINAAEDAYEDVMGCAPVAVTEDTP